jgi:two-component sensor histidine kinase
MEALFRLLPGPQSVLVRYGATGLLVLIGFALRAGSSEITGPYGFLFFILPIVASALLFDRGTGVFAVALSAGLVATRLTWNDATLPVHVGALATFAFVGGCLVFVAEGLHKALAKAHEAQHATDLLLQEMSHRVKNKFAMVSSIIGLQARRSTPEVRDALQDIASRVNIIATVHNFLQLSRREGLIDMSEYLPSLCKALQEALCGPRAVSLQAKAEAIKLPPEKALSAGVIVNELVTNAFKYAFDDDRIGHVRVEFVRANDYLVLSVSDDGKGRSQECEAGLGTRLVTVFAAQLSGDARWEVSPEGGCKATIIFPE